MMDQSQEQAAEAAADEAAEAAFAAGFGGNASAPPAAHEETAEPSPTPPPVESPSPPPVDPMASLPAEVRDALAQIPVMQQGLTELRRVAGHIPAMQSTVDRISKSIPPPAAPAPPREKLDKLRAADGLPEVADAIEEQMEHMRQQMAATVAPAPEPSASPAPATQNEDEAVRQMDAAIPDWRTIGGSKEFRSWAAGQKDGAVLLKTSDPLVFANAIGRYQEHKPAPAVPDLNAGRQARANAAVAPSGARPAVPATETIEDSFAKGFKTGRQRVSS